ncbi:hypothetical protein OH77DRAFT_1037838 [Trametes cingulata]|nr:hypothetical protein OH77DRAFT_1037838 [Trametes cingulata]
MEIDSQLSQLLNSLSLDSQRHKALFEIDEQASQTSRTPSISAHDAAMSDSSDSEDSTYPPNPYPPSRTPSSSSASAPQPQQPAAAPCGCAYLQALHGQIRAGAYATTGGDYLEAIFTHREAFFAFPPAHQGCALGFSALAQDLESRRAADPARAEASLWRADWDGDSEAAAAFRHEAWVIANAF